MALRSNIYLLLGFVVLITTILFVGLFRDDEFYNPSLFIKYRPTFKLNFYSPTGMSDMEMKNLSPDKQSEEMAFQEFVIQEHQQNKNNPILDLLPFVLIQLCLTLLTLGIYKQLKLIKYKNWQPAVHFIINLILLVLAIAAILSFDNFLGLSFFTFLILMSNYWILVLLTRRNIKQNN
jgi:hypothetical protein